MGRRGSQRVVHSAGVLGDGPLNPVVIGTLVVCLSLFLASPSISSLVAAFAGAQTDTRFDVFAAQVENPFVRVAGSEFLSFRILLPGALNILRMPAWFGLIAVAIAGIALIALLVRLLDAAAFDRRTSVAFAVGIACTPVLQGSHFYIGYPDTISWLILAVLMTARSPIMWAALIAAGMFNDERLIIGVPLALLVLLRNHRSELHALLRRALPYAVATGFALGLTYLIREGIRTGTIGGAPVASALPQGHDHLLPHFGTAQALGVLFAFTALWAVLGFAVARDFPSARTFWVATLAYVALASYATAWAADLWRGLAALFPAFVLAVLVLRERDPALATRSVSLAAVVMVLMPQIEQMGAFIRWMRPLPIAWVEWRQDASILDLLDLRALFG